MLFTHHNLFFSLRKRHLQIIGPANWQRRGNPCRAAIQQLMNAAGKVAVVKAFSKIATKPKRQGRPPKGPKNKAKAKTKSRVTKCAPKKTKLSRLEQLYPHELTQRHHVTSKD